MGDWSEILKEAKETPSQFDYIRNKYLKNLAENTGRNVIAYYSSWLNKAGAGNLDISDNDMEGFMNCLHGMDCSKGLDLVLHTPGGSPSAAEGIVNYLRAKFGKDIRVIVPHMAMSAGTMIACSAKEIIMGKQSNLGPIDPQFNGIPAYNIKEEFEEAKRDLAQNPGNAHYWAIKLRQYPAAFMKTAIDAIDLSGKLVEEWLGTCMFDKNKPEDAQEVRAITKRLNEHDNSKNHGRHLNIDFCKGIGLHVKAMEDDPQLQDAILSVHHAFMITLDATPAVKIIESQEKKTFVLSLGIR